MATPRSKVWARPTFVAVQRIEVLADGASSVYESDATQASTTSLPKVLITICAGEYKSMRRKLSAHFDRKLGCSSLFMLIACLVAPAANAAPQTFTTHLESVALTESQRPNVNGEGDVQAVLDGRTLTISGTFQGLPSAATRARVFRGIVVGAPGDPLFDLSVSPATSGTISGTLKLNSNQAAALRAEKLYVQIDSVNAPGTVSGALSAPNGTVWGWLMPQHEVPGQDVPEYGNWFLQ